MVLREKIRYGLLGAANIARTGHIPGLSQASNSECVAIASRSFDQAKNFSREYNIPKAYGSYEDLLADREIDAVIIPLPNSLHKEWVIKAAQAGKHIICEKPLALTPDEVAQMITAARNNQVLLMEGFMYRFQKQHEAVKEVLAADIIGEVRVVEAVLTYTMPDWENDSRAKAELGGGALFDAGCYCINALGWLLDQKSVSIHALQNLHPKNKVVKNLIGILKYADGRLGYMRTGMDQVFKGSIEVTGSHGRIVVPNAFVGDAVPTTITIFGQQKEVKSFAPTNQFQLQAEHFSDCILNDRQPMLTLEDSLWNTKILVGLAQAAASGKIVQVS